MKTWSEDIEEWRATTFGHATPERIWKRFEEELTELRTAIEAGASSLELATEAADCVIVLAGWVAQKTSLDLATRVTGKMTKNRARKWRVTADGVGYHIKEDAGQPVPLDQMKALQVKCDAQAAVIGRVRAACADVEQRSAQDPNAVPFMTVLRALAAAPEHTAPAKSGTGNKPPYNSSGHAIQYANKGSYYVEPYPEHMPKPGCVHNLVNECRTCVSFEQKLAAANARVAELERDLEEMRQKRNTARGHAVQAESEAAREKARADAAERATEAAISGNAAATDEARKQHEKTKRAKSERDEWKARAEELAVQLHVANARVAELEAINRGLGLEVTEARARVAELEEEASEYYSAGLRQAEELNAAIARADAAEQQRNDAAIEMSRCHRLWQEDKAALLRMNAAAERWERRNGELDLARERAESERDEWKAKCEAAERGRDDANRRERELQGELDRAECEAATPRRELARESKLRAQWFSAFEREESRADRLSAELDAAKGSNAALRHQVEMLMGTVANPLESEVAALRGELEHLRGEHIHPCGAREAKLLEMRTLCHRVATILRGADNYAARSQPDNDDVSVLDVPRFQLLELAEELEKT